MSTTSSTSIPPELLPYIKGELVDYSNTTGSIFKVNITFIILVTITLVLRLYVRMFMLRAAGLDDVLMILAVLSALVMFSVILFGAHHGLGEHIWNLDPNLLNIPARVSLLVKTLLAAYISYAVASSLTKLAIVASYIRIFPYPIIRRITFATGFVVAALGICSLFVICFSCYPIQALWNWNITDARCFSLIPFFNVAGAINIATDVILCVLPIPTLWSLKMPKAQRIVVSLLFSFGIFACVASILRLTQLYKLASSDVSNATVSPLNWSSAEVGTGIVCSCLSSLRPLASKIFPNFFQRLFTQVSSPNLEAYGTTKSTNPQTVPQSLTSNSDETFELIHQHPEMGKQGPPTPSPKDAPLKQAVIVSRSSAMR